MVIRVYNDVILGLTSPDWPWSHMNELLVPAQKALTQCDLPASGPANVWTAQPEILLCIYNVMRNIWKDSH